MFKVEWTNKDSLDLQQTCNKLATTEGDLISRADAIEAGQSVVLDAEAIEALKARPSAEPHNKDAISREGLLKSWEELSPRGRLEFDQVIMTIPALPSADAVQVVRCKDCCNLYNKDFCSFFGSPTEDMDYCSHGERGEPLPQYAEWKEAFDNLKVVKK